MPCTEGRESTVLKWIVFRPSSVTADVRLATSRSLVHSSSSADQIRRLSLWLELGPSLRDAIS
ncbi:hypothetical protein, partial [Roseiconus lacunae]